MKKYFTLFLPLFLLFFGLTFFPSYASSLPKLRINEIMANPSGSDSLYEWIELFNNSEAKIELSEWTLDNKQLPSYNLEPYSYIVLVRDTEAFNFAYGPANTIEFSFSLPNSGATLTLSGPSGSNEFTYSEVSEDISLEFIESPCNNIQNHKLNNSVGKQNTSCNSDTSKCEEQAEFIPNESLVYINSVMASPESGKEWLEITNKDNQEINLDNWTIKDISGNTFTISGLSISASETLIIYPETVTLNNSGDSLFLFDNQNQRIDTFVYPESTKGIKQHIQNEQTASVKKESKSNDVSLAIPNSSITKTYSPNQLGFYKLF